MAESDPSSPEITVWIQAMEAGDEQATTRLFEHCFPRLLQYARKRLPERFRRALDEEDVALSAFKSFHAAARRGALGDVKDRESLWRLLACITARKGDGYVRHELRQKRGGGDVRGESVFAASGNESAGIDNVAKEMTPQGIAEFQSHCCELLGQLGDPNLEVVALLRLEGYSVDEIAERTQTPKRSVERRLSLIRRIWTESDEALHAKKPVG